MLTEVLLCAWWMPHSAPTRRLGSHAINLPMRDESDRGDKTINGTLADDQGFPAAKPNTRSCGNVCCTTRLCLPMPIRLRVTAFRVAQVKVSQKIVVCDPKVRPFEDCAPGRSFASPRPMRTVGPSARSRNTFPSASCRQCHNRQLP